ncbi:C25 family cysteine peptidase [Saccharopolyspora phatthalungensis]|uniref:Gingipain domain-containing protein n=1 Tax=Saccharopolyspora phatthalungensis TaxID=664693 RepID=A0A840QGJ5_9PSEU|nr:C25 family cysteine peptidase [Saccharopolyspora phatthalungensis]MBB5159221.1 hypothetical protein [Saccharopolyspora phatthalungensis]
MGNVVKLVVTNNSVLLKKYKESGLKVVQNELENLIKADEKRGITTTVVDMSNKQEMDKYKAPVVTDSTDDKQNKDAVDAVFTFSKPAYLMILGSYDVVPHVELTNPVYNSKEGDTDRWVPSDLPYACETSYAAGGKDPAKYTSASRVVGRLPDITESSDSSYLVSLIKGAASAAPLEKSTEYFGLSTEKWEGSSTKNAAQIFGSSDKVNLVPPKGSPWEKAALVPVNHFVNCHGAAKDPQWYGQSKDYPYHYPVALKAGDIDQGITKGAIVTAECCYGALLYSPDASTRMAICNTYLFQGASMVLGSTTIAYGPSASCDWADLIVQYAFQEVLNGQSTGYATLKTRQDYVKNKPHLDGIDLKTLAQFILLGDPSLKPVKPPQKVAEADMHAAVTERRREAQLIATTLEQSVSVPVPIPDSERSSELEARLREIGENHGLSSLTISSFAGVWTGDRDVLEAVGQPPRIHLLHGQRDPDAPVHTGVIVIVREQEGTVVSVDEAEAR